MRKYGITCVFSFILIAMFCLTGHAFADQEAPDGEVAAPPPLDVSGPPDVVVVPSEQYPNQYVYMVPNMEGVYVYQGMWYRNYGGVWFSSPAYNGIWLPIGVAIVPPVIVSVPPEYALYLPPGYHRIHYGYYHSHWREWDRSRYWHRQNWYRNEMRAEIGRDRMRHIEQHRREVRAQQAVDKKRYGRDADAGGKKDVARGGKDFAKPGVRKDQNIKGDQPQPRQKIQKQSQPRQQVPKQQIQKRPQPKKQDDNKNKH